MVPFLIGFAIGALFGFFACVLIALSADEEGEEMSKEKQIEEMAKLIDTRKQGWRKYIVPDLIFDCIKEGVSTDYKLFKYLSKWIDKAFSEYNIEEVQE